jgi:hypothetical protein
MSALSAVVLIVGVFLAAMMLFLGIVDFLSPLSTDRTPGFALRRVNKQR